jgi:hypothetical protein
LVLHISLIMLKEIYCRNANDPYYVYTKLETNEPLEALLTKLRMIIFTNRGEVLAYPDLGLDLDIMLFELTFNAYQIQKEFYAQVAKFVPEARNYNINLEVNFVPGTVRDICYIDIYIDGTKYLGVVAK